MDNENAPEELEASEQIFDIAFHPSEAYLAAGLIDGAVEIFRYGLGEGTNQKVMSCNHHSGSCRGVLFSEDGQRIFTIGSDKSIQGLNASGARGLFYENAHDTAINKLAHLTENVLVTGDDDGTVKVWDIRTPTGEVMNWSLHEDFVSGFCFVPDKNTLLSVGGDARLCAYDVRNPKNTFRSDDQEAEMHCVDVIKGGRKIVCGTQDGVILIFSWDRWGDCSDRYPGHPETVDCLLKLDESTVLTGSSDGLIRIVQIQPNKVLGVLGDHDEFPVEGLRKRGNKLLPIYVFSFFL